MTRRMNAVRRAVTWSAGVFLLIVVVAGGDPTRVAAVSGVGVCSALAAWWWRARRRSSRKWRVVRNELDREIYVYAAGSMDRMTRQITHVKFGHSAQPHGRRERQIEQVERQVPRTHTVVALARGPGGHPREKDFHRRLSVHRYPRSEWFAIHPDVVAAVRELERPTEVGRRFLKAYR